MGALQRAVTDAEERTRVARHNAEAHQTVLAAVSRALEPITAADDLAAGIALDLLDRTRRTAEEMGRDVVHWERECELRREALAGHRRPRFSSTAGTGAAIPDDDSTGGGSR